MAQPFQGETLQGRDVGWAAGMGSWLEGEGSWGLRGQAGAGWHSTQFVTAPSLA